ALPFHGSSMEIIGQQLGATPAPLRSLIPTISPAVEQVVLTALAKDPHARFQSIKTFANELSRASQEQEAQTTFSYTATTVVEPRPKAHPKAIHAPFQPDLGEVIQRPVAVPDPVLPTTLPNAQTSRSASAPTQAQVHTSEKARPTPYLQPAAPYVPLAEQALPRIGWTVFWPGLALGIVLLVIHSPIFFAPFPVPYIASILLYPLLSFIGGWWVTQRTGVLRASIFAALWPVFWVLCGYIFYSALFSLDYAVTLPTLMVNILIGIAVSTLGGAIGIRIHRSRQSIHPPAGGSISR
ncbi:MAG: hypothetical protein ACRDHW_11620, partial [Ktedonobacteraceae bacterium]